MNKPYGRLMALGLLGALALTGCGTTQNLQDTLSGGMTAIENGQYEEALTAFENVVSQGELQVEAYRGMGIAYMGLQDYDQAVDFFDLALSCTDDRMDGTRKDLYYYKATALYKEESYTAASGVCDEILKLANEGDAHYIKGACALAVDDTETAETEFQAAAALNPNDYDMLLNIYDCYAKKSLTAIGDTYLQQALQSTGAGTEAVYQKALIYYYLEEYDNAKAILSSSAEAQDADSQILMGKIYLALEDTTHARAMYQSYISAHGETPESLNGIALCDIAEGSYEAALENIEKGQALSEEKGQQELAYNAIVCYENLGDFEAAKTAAAAYVQAYPEDQEGKREYAFLQNR